MEPSPRKRQPPAMPGPVRLVRRSILAAERAGLSRAAARSCVLQAVASCRAYLDIEQGWLATWFNQLVAEAERQAGVLPPGDTTRKDTPDGHQASPGRKGSTGPAEAETRHDT